MIPTTSEARPLVRVPRVPLLVGIACWSAIAAAGAIAVARLPATERERSSAALADIARLATQGTVDRDLVFPGAYPWLEPGDGIYRRDGFELLRCGQIVTVDDTPEGRRVRVAFDPALNPELATSPTLTAFSSGASIAWTFRSLLPDHVQNRITTEWSRFLAANEGRLTQVLLPLAKDLLREAGPLVLDEATAAFGRRRAELDRIAARYRTEFVEPRLLPLIENELWPRLTTHGAPALETLGKDLWAELPLLSMAWQGVKQEFDFSDENRVQQRFRDFVTQDAPPILAKHAPALKDALLIVAKDAANDPEVAQSLRDSLQALLADAELRDLLVDVLEDVIRGDRLKELVSARLADETAAKTIGELRKELDEVFRSIGKKIVFSNETTYEVQPDFARFLRTLVLKKDRRWILFEPGTSASASASTDTPLVGVVAPE